MPQTGYTQILIYGSGTAGHTPSAGNLTSSASGAELALNYTDGILFYKDNNGSVQNIAQLGGNPNAALLVGAATLAGDAVRADQVQLGSVTSFTTGGTSTAFTLTPTPAITAYAANQQFDVIFSAACGASATLAISGVATPPTLVRQNADGSYSNLLANAFPAGWQSPVKLLSVWQAVVMKLPKRVFSGFFTLNTASASGTQSVTGVGFQPKAIRFHAGVLSTLRNSIGESVNLVNFCTYQQSTGNSYLVGQSIYLENAGADYYTSPVSYDADGFTLTTTRIGTPTGTASVFFTAEEW